MRFPEPSPSSVFRPLRSANRARSVAALSCGAAALDMIEYGERDCTLTRWRRSAGVVGNAAIWAAHEKAGSISPTSADRASDRSPALPHRRAAFSINRPRCNDAPAVPAGSRLARRTGFQRGFRDAGVKARRGLAQQRAIGGVLDQGVFEQIGRRRRALPEQQTGRGRTAERFIRAPLPGLRTTEARKRMRKFPADRRADLRYLLGRAEPCSSRAISEVQARGDGQAGDGNRGGGPLRFALVPSASSTRLAHLLHEQRSAVGVLRCPGGYPPGVVCCRATARVDHGVDFAPREPIDREGGHVRTSDPAPNSAGRYDGAADSEDPRSGPPSDRTLPGCWWGRSNARPEHHQHRLWRASASICETSAPAPSAMHRSSGITSRRSAQRQHLGEQRGVLDRGRGLREQRIKLVDFCLQHRQSGGFRSIWPMIG